MISSLPLRQSFLMALIFLLKIELLQCLKVPYTKSRIVSVDKRPNGFQKRNYVVSGVSFPNPKTLDKTSVDLLLERINELNNLTPQFKQTLTPFIVDQDIYGYIDEDSLKLFKQYTSIFTYKQNYIMDKPALLLNPDIAKLSMEERTAKVHQVSLDFKEKKLVHGWRNEFVPVKMKISCKPAFLIERSMYSLFGLKGYGCHVNGYVRNKNSEITHLWVGTRSKTKSTWPGQLDHIVAGGLPYGVTPMENVIKECEEEANIPEELAIKSIPTGAVSYMGVSEENHIKRDVLMVFDLELPLDFIPKPVDGEVEKFELHSIDYVLEHILNGKYYKPNCHLVIIDFLVRYVKIIIRIIS